ncbi:MAG: hypothetical protein NTW05_00055 [Pseudonocardiales bacterium]|nr:hypothetical protein [Pseudonocardiales bacterium]
MTITTTVLLTGALLSAAPVPADTPPVQPPITLTAEQSAALCQERIPALLARIDRLTDRIDGDATAVGSTAWLEERVAVAREAGRDARADALQRRLEGRPEVTDRLAEVERRVTAFRDDHCVA